MNKVILSGNVGSVYELRKTENGNSVINFSLATNDRKKETLWHKCVAFGKLAEIINQYVRKGDSISIDGRISYRIYESNGEERNVTEIIVDDFEFIGKRKHDTDNVPY